jgi:O-acetylserine/cysteine efflux transporter
MLANHLIVSFDRLTTSDRRAAIVALAVSGSLWGLTVPLSKLSLDWLGPAWLTVARFAVAAPLLALLARGRLRAALAPPVVAAGAVGYGGVILLQNAGIERTSVSHAALIVGAIPVMVTAIAAIVGRGAVGPGAWAGSLLALAGVGLVAGSGGAGTSVAGDLLVLLSVTASAAFIVAQPRLLRGRDPAAVTAVQLGAGALAALPVAALAEGVPPAPPEAGPAIAVIALALAGTALAFWLFTWAQARVPPELAGAFANLEPLVGALTGAVAFNDAFGPAQMLGGAAIVAGIALGALPRRRRMIGARRRRTELPVDRTAVAEEPAGGAAVGQRGRPHDPGRTGLDRPAARAAHVRGHPARADGVHQHAVAPQCVREHQRERVERGLRD